MRLAAQRLRRLDKIINPAVARLRGMFVLLIWSMQCGIQFTISALARSFHSGLSIV